MNVDELASTVTDYMRLNDYVSFAEIQNRFGANGELQGQQCITLGAPNVIAWAGMSETYCAAMLRLLDAGVVHMWPSSVLVYLADGGMLRMPLVGRVPKAGYKKPHWFPVTLRTVPRPKRQK